MDGRTGVAVVVVSVVVSSIVDGAWTAGVSNHLNVMIWERWHGHKRTMETKETSTEGEAVTVC